MLLPVTQHFCICKGVKSISNEEV